MCALSTLFQIKGLIDLRLNLEAKSYKVAFINLFLISVSPPYVYACFFPTVGLFRQRLHLYHVSLIFLTNTMLLELYTLFFRGMVFDIIPQDSCLYHTSQLGCPVERFYLCRVSIHDWNFDRNVATTGGQAKSRA